MSDGNFELVKRALHIDGGDNDDVAKAFILGVIFGKILDRAYLEADTIHEAMELIRTYLDGRIGKDIPGTDLKLTEDMCEAILDDCGDTLIHFFVNF